MRDLRPYFFEEKQFLLPWVQLSSATLPPSLPMVDYKKLVVTA
jgi:hypothetical protein